MCGRATIHAPCPIVDMPSKLAVDREGPIDPIVLSPPLLPTNLIKLEIQVEHIDMTFAQKAQRWLFN